MKEAIFAAAKREFYENGFMQGTLISIARRVNVPQGLINYHFSTKNGLVGAIFEDFTKRIFTRINAKEYLADTDALYKQIVYSHIYYTIIFSDEANIRFYKEIRLKNVPYTAAYQEKQTYDVYIRNNLNTISSTEMKILMILNSAGRREFFNRYFEENWTMTVPEIVNILEGAAARLFQIDNDLLNKFLVQAHNIITDIDYSDIRLLI